MQGSLLGAPGLAVCCKAHYWETSVVSSLCLESQVLNMRTLMFGLCLIQDLPITSMYVAAPAGSTETTYPVPTISYSRFVPPNLSDPNY